MPDLQPINIGNTGQTASYDPEVAATPSLGAQFDNTEIFETGIHQMFNGSMGGTTAIGRMGARLEDQSPYLSAEDANSQFGVQGPTPALSLSWKPGESVRTDTARQQQQLMQGRIQDAMIMARRPDTWGSAAAAFGGDLLGTLLDPLNIASTFMPVSWLGRGAALAARVTQFGDAAAATRAVTDAVQASWATRTGTAALQNAAGVALTQPILMAGAQADHTDYSFADAAQNVLFGGLLGGALHGLGEGLGYLADGSTARGMMRGAAASMTGTEALHPELAEDMVNASRAKVIEDLTAQDGAAPSDEDIQSEMQRRQSLIFDKKAAGVYDPEIPQPELFDDPGDVPARISDAVDQGDHEAAAGMMRQWTESLESQVGDRMSPEDIDEAHRPVSTVETIRSLLSDFSECVAQAAA